MEVNSGPFGFYPRTLSGFSLETLSGFIRDSPNVFHTFWSSSTTYASL